MWFIFVYYLNCEHRRAEDVKLSNTSIHREARICRSNYSYNSMILAAIAATPFNCDFLLLLPLFII